LGHVLVTNYLSSLRASTPKRRDIIQKLGSLGASGSVMTTTILFALFDPKKIIIVNFIPMPAFLFAVFSVGYELIGLRWNDGLLVRPCIRDD
jgi:membrane associated rhomboid family serine protease